MRFLGRLLVVVCIAYGIGVYTAIPVNPEVAFWKQLMEVRKKEVAQVRQQNPDKRIIFFTGGSSCAFSVDPKIVEDICGLSAFNLGLPVFAGNKYILNQALEQTHKGDILIVCIEPDTLTCGAGSPSTPLAFALGVLDGKPSDAAGGGTFSGKLSFRDYLNLSRPGSRYIATWLIKFFVRKGYRYTPQDIRYHGRLETTVSDPGMQASGPNPATRLSVDGRELLKSFKVAADARGVRVAYSMPWVYTAEGSVTVNRANKGQLMGDIGSIMPAIDDGFTGVVSEAAYFADSGLHLTAKGSAVRSQALARALDPWIVKVR